MKTPANIGKTLNHPKLPEAQVEVQPNSPFFCVGRPAGPIECIISPPMPAAPHSPAKSQTAGLAPERSLTQRMDALKRANEIRTRRARLKRDLKAGRAQIHGLLLDPPEYLATAKVFDLLLAVPSTAA